MSQQDIFKFGTVISTSDDFDGGRVRVHIKGVDSDNYSNASEIPLAFPLLPKIINVKPREGELVLVFTQDGDYNGDRYWLGPIISQPQKIAYDGVTADSLLQVGVFAPDKAPSSDPDNNGVQFGDDDIGLNGRGSTDVVVKPNEIRIHAGKTFDNIKLNKDNPSYIQNKFDVPSKTGNINIVSDKINFLSHKSKTKFNLTNPDDLITEEEFNKIIEKAHVLPYGDVLVDFIVLMKKAFTTHIHQYAGLPPDKTQKEVKDFLDFDLKTMLSEDVRIN